MGGENLRTALGGYSLHNKRKTSPSTWFFHIPPSRACKDRSEGFSIHRIVLRPYSVTAANNRLANRTRYPSVWRSYADGRRRSIGRCSRAARRVRTVSSAGGYSCKTSETGQLPRGFSWRPAAKWRGNVIPGDKILLIQVRLVIGTSGGRQRVRKRTTKTILKVHRRPWRPQGTIVVNALLCSERRTYSLTSIIIYQKKRLSLKYCYQ